MLLRAKYLKVAVFDATICPQFTIAEQTVTTLPSFLIYYTSGSLRIILSEFIYIQRQKYPSTEMNGVQDPREPALAKNTPTGTVM